MKPGTILKLRDGYARTKAEKETTHAFRVMTREEAMVAHEVWFVSVKDGMARRAKVNGRPKVWKTRPDNLELPIKYGMYECVRLLLSGGSWSPATPLIRLYSDEE